MRKQQQADNAKLAEKTKADEEERARMHKLCEENRARCQEEEREDNQKASRLRIAQKKAKENEN